MVVKNTFVQKSSEFRKVTFFKKGSCPTHLIRNFSSANFVDYTTYREIDHVLISAKYTRSVTDTFPKQDLKVGRTTHHPVLTYTRFPPVVRAKHTTSAPSIPRLAWKDSTIVAKMAAEISKQFTEIRGTFPTFPSNPYHPRNCRSPDMLDGEGGYEISMDGSFLTYPSVPAPSSASFGFVVLQGIFHTQHDRRKPRPIVFRRWGPVVLDPQNPLFIGATHFSNNTGEISAFIEAIFWLLLEAPLEVRTSNILFTYDSTLAGNQTSGDWLIKSTSVNCELATVAHRAWNFLSPEESPIFSAWVKGHSKDFANERADSMASKGHSSYSNPRRSMATVQIFEFLQTVQCAISPCESRVLSAEPEAIYAYFLAVHSAIAKTARELVPKAKPRKPWQSIDLQRLADERSRAWKAGDTTAADGLTVEMTKQSRREKASFLKALTEAQGGVDWEGPKRMKPFPNRPLQIENKFGSLVPTAMRAEVFAEFYETQQWADEPSPPLPPRPIIFEEAAIPVSPFTPQELRRARGT
jgi:ribonuclease HI